jgi:DNA-binding response OmpR family regulator
VLVVEDDAVVRELLLTLLADVGYATMAAEDGWRALEICAEREPDLVVLDLQLPGFGGLEFLERHRTSHQCTGKVVVVTARSMTEHDRQAHRIDAVICKPFDIDEFLATVRALVG